MANWRAGTVVETPDGKARCEWVADWRSDPALLAYHDTEWATPTKDPSIVFETLSLGVFEAGLNWLTVLHKRDAFRRAFHGFDVPSVAAMTAADVDTLAADAAIVRNRAKIEAIIHNAALAMGSDVSLADRAWSFAPDGHDRPRSGREVPVSSPEAVALASALKSDGYKFVGPTSVYGFMQSIGIVDDHIVGCFRANQHTT